MNLKAMLVDDEVHILNNLKQVIPWEELDIEVFLARNGMEALELASAERPDLILCDIRMPVMDGMAFLREYRKIDSDCEIIMLTGYEEFEYARVALQHGVRDYISKPINYEELEETVRNIVGLIRAHKLEKMVAERRWGRVVRLAYEKMMFDQLMGYSLINERYVISEADQNVDDLEYALFLVDLDGYSQRSTAWNDNERKLWNFAVNNVLQEALHDCHIKYAALQTREGEWCLIVQFFKGMLPLREEKAMSWAAKLREAVKQNVKFTVSVGIEHGPIRLDGLSEAYKNIQRLLLVNPLSEQIISVKNKSHDHSNPTVSEWQLIEDIVSGLRHCDRAKIERTLQSLQSNLLAMSEQSLVRAERLLHYVVIHLLREMREMDVISTKEEEAVWKNLQHSVSVKDLLQMIAELVHRSTDAALNKKSSELLMISAKDYITRNLSSDIGIEEIADHLGISCSYFSLLFKNHFGETFVEYLTKQRMELAKSLLLMSDKSITQIGSLVGYLERRYFTKVFQKYTGMTPSEYRERKDAGI
ncbi:Regulator of RpoS [Paenibacillus sp. CECT 9249]|uniref:response regulator n=1 Tax=Paenibacillus sp. CECT 9249 TaxID=2845385 RepID=UPI001E2F9206|nr:response regulator [Paenibacillus sp. CECT 9249]CAH0118566.1 Regulator of RpoS [Paenibacillus sp. CECT 9249]